MMLVQYFSYITNMKHKINPYPTRSLREYLAYRSVQYTESEQEQPMDSYESPRIQKETQPRIEVEVQIGDGRSQVIVVDEQTDIRKEAQLFCEKYRLEEYVSDLLAETIRDKYELEKEERLSQSIAHQQNSLAELHSHPHAREVLINDSQQDTDRISQASRVEKSRKSNKEELKRSAEKGASRILRNSQFRHKKYSVGQAYLFQNKENQPELNKMSLQICEKLGKENILQHCSQRSKQKYAAILRQRQAKQQEAMRECPFRPQINIISKQVDIASSALTQTNPSRRFQRLYQQHKAMQQRREEERHQMMQQIPFKPALNHISLKIVQNKRANNDSQDHIDKRHQKSCVNSTTNSLPHTGRAPISRNTQNLPIGEYLYAQAMKKTKQRVPEQHPQVRALQHSQQLVATLKEKRINQVFNELTQPPHQELFGQDINLEQQKFRTGKLRFFMPIFTEMIQLGLSLTRPEFMQACLALFKTLSPDEKHEVIFFREKNDQPMLLKNKSRQNLKRHPHQEDLYNRGLMHRRLIQEKNQQRRESRARQELRHCTFRPAIRHS